jgi:hypothetical protein
MIIGSEVKQTHVYEPSDIHLVILKQYITDTISHYYDKQLLYCWCNIVILII